MAHGLMGCALAGVICSLEIGAILEATSDLLAVLPSSSSFLPSFSPHNQATHSLDDLPPRQTHFRAHFALLNTGLFTLLQDLFPSPHSIVSPDLESLLQSGLQSASETASAIHSFSRLLCPIAKAAEIAFILY
jgi:hypothetical protein